MALSATDRGTGTDNTSATTFTLSPSGNFAAGSWACLNIASDNSEASGAAHTTFTVTDSLGNTWTRRITARVPGAGQNGGSEGGIFTTDQAAGALTTGTTITVTFGVNTTAKAWTLHEIVPTAGKEIAITASGSGSGLSTTLPAATSQVVAIGNLILGVLFCERGTDQVFTGDADTTNGNWSTQQTTSVGTTTSGQGISSQVKVVTGTGAQTYNPTLGTAADCIASWISFTEYTDGDPIPRGNGNNTTSSTTATLSLSDDFESSSSLAVLIIGADNSEVNGVAHTVFTITDSLGNTWSRKTSPLYDPGAADAGVEGAIFTTDQAAGKLTRTTTITVTFNVNTPNKAYTFLEVPNGAVVSSGSGTGAGTTTPTVTTGSITNDNIVIGAVFNELGTIQVVTGDGDTTNGTWEQLQQASTPSTGISVAVQWKRVTAAGTQTFNPTLGSSSDVILSWVEVSSAAAASGGARRRRLLT